MQGAGPIGLILAGGQARRLGGGDKTLQWLAGRPLLAAIVERLAPQCQALVLNANGDSRRFESFSLEVVPDHPDDRACGPLAGVLAGLDRVAGCSAPGDAMLTVTGDAPFLPPDLVSRLMQAYVAEGAAVAIACSGGRDHPLMALWSLAARGALRHAIRAEGRRRVLDVVAALGVTRVSWPDTSPDPFFNVNTPDDLATAALWAQERAA